MRVTVQEARIKANKLHQIDDITFTAFRIAYIVNVKRLEQNIFNRHARIQRGKRILEYHLYLAAVIQTVPAQLT